MKMIVKCKRCNEEMTFTNSWFEEKKDETNNILSVYHAYGYKCSKCNRELKILRWNKYDRFFWDTRETRARIDKWIKDVGY